MAQGRIQRLMGQRGFGFISTDKRQEYFFHASSVRGVPFDDLREGQQVEFTIERDPRGRGERAADVRVIGA